MSDRYPENDSGQDLPDPDRVWVSLCAMSLVALLAFLFVYAWAKW